MQVGGSGGSSFMAHGVQYEDEARVKYEAMAGERVLEYGLMIHPDPALSWLGASPDGVTETTGQLLEVKWYASHTSLALLPHIASSIKSLLHVLAAFKAYEVSARLLTTSVLATPGTPSPPAADAARF